MNLEWCCLLLGQCEGLSAGLVLAPPKRSAEARRGTFCLTDTRDV